MFIDLRSDTVTMQPKEMILAMNNALVGDDVYGEDQTTRELEILASNILGKEDSLFIPSGTFGNQLSILTHTNRGDEVILGDECHVIAHEVGAGALISNVQFRTIPNVNGKISPLDIKSRIRKGEDDIHFPSTSLIIMENATSNGSVISLSTMSEVYKIAKEKDVNVHLDGARLFNAALALNTTAKEICKYTDSVMFCLSKGLCSPIGSIVSGSKEFINRARKNRKLMGGGLRQSGYLSAAGIYSLNNMVERLNDDHKNAKYLTELLKEIPQIEVNLEKNDINMVFFKINNKDNLNALKDFMFSKNIKINDMENGEFRFVTHYLIEKEDIDTSVSVLKEWLRK